MESHKRRYSSKKGLMPGTPIYIGTNPPKHSECHVYIYSGTTYQKYENFDMAIVNKAIEDGLHIWIDICGLADMAFIQGILKEFKIHPLCIEDIFNTKQRPKVDVIEDYLYIVVKLLKMKAQEDIALGTEQLSIIKKNNILISIRETEKYDFSPLYKKLQVEPSLTRQKGSDYLIYLMLDTIIDDYFRFTEHTSDYLQEIEEELLEASKTVHVHDLYALKRQSIILRRTIAPIRDMIHLLISECRNHFMKTIELYLLDLHDHCIRLVEEVDMQREVIKSLLDMNLSIQNNLMNETMKTLTIFASLFIPLTFIAGVYGMNFKYMPELNWTYSYPVVLFIMFLIACAMLYHFKRKKLW